MGNDRETVLDWMERTGNGWRTAAQRFELNPNTVKSWQRRWKEKRKVKIKTYDGVMGETGSNGKKATPRKDAPPPKPPPPRTAPPGSPPGSYPLTPSGGSKFDDTHRAAVLDAIRLGAPLRLAAAAGRISLETLKVWMGKGRKARQRQSYLDEHRPGKRIPDDEMEFLVFIGDTEHAEYQFVRANLASVLVQIRPTQKAGVDGDGNPVVDPKTGRPVQVTMVPGDGSLALKFLKSRLPRDYSDRVDHTVNDGKPVDVRHTFDFSEIDQDALLAKRTELEELKRLKRMEDDGLILDAPADHEAT